MSSGKSDVLDPEVDQGPSQDEIGNGLQDLENYANQGNSGDDDDDDSRDDSNDSPEDRRNKRNTRDEKENRKNRSGKDKGKSGKGGGKAAQSGEKAAANTAKGAAKTGAKAGAKAGTRVAVESAVAAGGAAESFGLSILAAAAFEATYQAIRHPKKAAKYLFLVALLIIGIFIWSLYAYQLLSGIISSGRENTEGLTPLLTLTKTGPTEAKINQELVYTIGVAYPKAVQDIVLVDQIPVGAEFVSSSNKVTYDAVTRSVTWKARENIPPPQAASESAYPAISTTFTITLKATQDNVWLVNIVRGQATPAIATGGSCSAPNTSSGDFNVVLAGQGRCVNILGDENQFVATVLKNSNGKLFSNAKEPNLRQIYKVSVAKNVNPLIILTIWGIETSFGTTGPGDFNCGSGGGNFVRGFENSLTCVTNAANKWMGEYEKQQSKGVSPITVPDKNPKCAYTDAFVYTFEWLTPVCHFSHNNDGARANFVRIYKQLYGTGPGATGGNAAL